MADCRSILILVGGGHAAGKHAAQKLLLKELAARGITNTNPSQSIDMDNYKIEHVTKEPLKPSRYDFHAIKEDIKKIPKGHIVVLIGLYALYDKELRDMANMKIFIDSDPDTRLIRWIRKETTNKQVENNEQALKKLESVLDLYLNGARAEMSDYIFHTKEYADVIMPRGVEQQSVTLIIDGVQTLLDIKPNTNILRNSLRPSRFSKEKFDNEKGKFYDLN